MAEKIGSVLNQYSNQVVVLVGDAVALATWKGSEEPSYEDVVDGNLFAGGDGRVSHGGAQAQLLDGGGCGSVEVLRIDERTWMLAEHYVSDAPGADSDYVRAATAPFAKEEPIGSLVVESGTLAIYHAPEAATAVGLPQILKLKSTGALEASGGVIVRCANGQVDILRDGTEIKGPWGIIASRHLLRVCPG